MTDLIESDSSTGHSCDIDYDLSYEYDVALDCDFEFKPRLRNGLKSFRKISNFKNIDQSRLKLLSKVALMKIPERSIKILSKFVINHQLQEIVKVLKTSRNCVTIHAKVNPSNIIYRELESDDVIIKIFTLNKHASPDRERAKKYTAQVNSRDRNKWKFMDKHKTNQGYFNHLLDNEDLLIIRADNVVVMKMIGVDRRALNLVEMIKKYPQRRREFYRDIIELAKLFRSRSFQYWHARASVKDILWHNNEWNFICHPQQVNCSNWKKMTKADNFFRNVFAIMKLFQRFGLSVAELKESYVQVFRTHRKYDYNNEWKKIVEMFN